MQYGLLVSLSEKGFGLPNCDNYAHQIKETCIFHTGLGNMQSFLYEANITEHHLGDIWEPPEGLSYI